MTKFAAFLREKQPVFGSGIIDSERTSVVYLAHRGEKETMMVTKFTEEKFAHGQSHLELVHTGTEMSAKSFINIKLQELADRQRMAELNNEDAEIYVVTEQNFLVLPQAKQSLPDDALVRAFANADKAEKETPASKSAVHASWAHGLKL